MKWNRLLSISFVLVMVEPTFAQQHHQQSRAPQGGGMHGGGVAGGGVHPGQGIHPGMMSPEHQMMHEFYMEQMWMNQMMGSRQSSRGQGHHNQGQMRSGMNASANSHSSHHSQGQGPSQAAMNQRSKPSHSPEAQTHSSSAAQQHSNHANGKKSKHESEAAKEARRKRELAAEKFRAKERAAASTSTRAADSGAIRMLRNVHGKLQRADTDYQGHRVRAMEHIETAIHHLGSTSGTTMGAGSVLRASYIGGAGNKSQGESDQIVRDAIFQLNKVQQSLDTGSNAAAHHRSAHAAITQAIHELQAAVKIR